MRYFDLHCDTIAECALQNKELYHNDLFVSLERASHYKTWAQFFAIFTPDNIRGEDAVKRFDSIYSVFISEIEKNTDIISFCRSGAQMQSAVEKAKNVAFLSIEGGAALGGNIDKLFDVYQKGVRLITLTWNGTCELGDGCMVTGAGGLTPFGREVVCNMTKLGMIIDVSHLSQQGFYDVASSTQAAFVASHSNSRAICEHARNLTDEQIKEIIRRGGLIGLNLYPPFINNSTDTKLCDILPHAEHILSLGGEDVLAIGADFDGADMPPDIKGIEDIAKLYDIFVNNNNDKVTNNIFFDNAYKYMSSL